MATLRFPSYDVVKIGNCINDFSLNEYFIKYINWLLFVLCKTLKSPKILTARNCF